MLTAVEFFSGIGAFAVAARQLGIIVVAAFDQSEQANLVYELNHGLRPSSRNLDTVELESIPDAEIWWISAPCTPYTVRGKRKDAGDPRARSFMRLIELLPQRKPRFVAVENVGAFAGSAVHGMLVCQLERCCYNITEQFLCSSQFGVPMRRPRFFLVAELMDQSEPERGEDLVLPRHAPEQPAWREEQPDARLPKRRDRCGEPAPAPQLLERTTSGEESACPSLLSDIPAQAKCSSAISNLPLSFFLAPIAAGGTESGALDERLIVDAGEVARYGEMYDIVDPQDAQARAICFTSGYGKSQKVSGSLIRLPDGRLRRFAPAEILGLLGFPKDFVFPSQLELRACWRLAGNSVDVRCIVAIMEKLIPLKTPVALGQFNRQPDCE